MSDKRAERMLGAFACAVLAVIVFMVVFVVGKAWPSFSHNGLGWFGSPGIQGVNHQLDKILMPPTSTPNYKLNAGPIVGATAMITGFAVVLALPFAILSSIFIVELAPRRARAMLMRVVRLLAAVPSVVYGLIALLVIVPYVGNHLISVQRKVSVASIVQLTGASLLVGVVVLAVMITPIMIAITVDALDQVPRAWVEGATALGINRIRVMRTISLRTVRPAIIAAVVLATGRALGEAIMLSMVAGTKGFAPNPLDGLTFFFEPARTLAATIVGPRFSPEPDAYASTLFAMAALLLLSSFVLSLGAYFAKQPLKRYAVRV